MNDTQSKDNAQPALTINASRQFVSWLNEQNASICFSTYQVGKLFFIGLKPDGQLSIFERTFNRCMGIGRTDNGFYMSSLYQLWNFTNAIPGGQNYQGYDAVYLPQFAYTTGDIDVHDIGARQNQSPIFVNTLFSCLCEPSNTHSFKPIWKPTFIDRLAAEDRCHLNGLAMRDGRPAYVTAVSTTNVSDGWRDHRTSGGVAIDVASNEVIASDLSMPHSPRWHNGKLWLLNSGRGEFGYIDSESGKFEPIAFLPGYCRGMNFIGDYALVGLSHARNAKSFTGLAIDDRLKKEGVNTRCGINVIDLKSGDIKHWLQIEGVVEEIYDVIALPNVKRPMALGLKTDEIRRFITIEDDLTEEQKKMI